MGGERDLVYLVYGNSALVEIRLLQWLGCFAFLVFRLNPNFCLWVFIICATVSSTCSPLLSYVLSSHDYITPVMTQYEGPGWTEPSNPELLSL